jgi:hypothetical protein
MYYYILISILAVGIISVSSDMLVKNNDLKNRIANESSVSNSLVYLTVSNDEKVRSSIKLSDLLVEKADKNTENITLLNKLQEAISLVIDDNVNPTCADLALTGKITEPECDKVSGKSFAYFDIEEDQVKLEDDNLKDAYLAPAIAMTKKSGIQYSSDGSFVAASTGSFGLEKKIEHLDEVNEVQKDIIDIVSSDTTGEITLAVSESISEDKETSNSYLREVVATQVKKIEDNIEKEVLEKSYSHALASKEDIDSVMQNIEEEMQTPVAQRLETIKEKMALYQIDSLSNDSESNIDYSNNDYTYSVESEKLYSEAAVRKEQLINSLEVVEKKIESIQESLSNEDNTFADNTRYKYELKTLSNKKLIYQKKYNSINNSISYGSY